MKINKGDLVMVKDIVYSLIVVSEAYNKVEIFYGTPVDSHKNLYRINYDYGFGYIDIIKVIERNNQEV